MDLIIKLAEYGLVHGDFNEFNLMIDDEEVVTMIDFPQMVSTSHPNAEYYFHRDVQCVQVYFAKHYGLKFDGMPTLERDVDREVDLDKEVKASGFLKEQLGKDIKNVTKMFDQIAEQYLDEKTQAEEDQEDEDDDEEDEEEEKKSNDQNSNQEEQKEQTDKKSEDNN